MPRAIHWKPSDVQRVGICIVGAFGALILGWNCTRSLALPPSDDANLRMITIDYPEQQILFPPEITSPTFIWRDDAKDSSTWIIDVKFADGSSALRVRSAGEKLSVGQIDSRCVSVNNELPKLTPEQAGARTWVPDQPTWEAIKRHSKQSPATITITGFQSGRPDRPVSRGSVVVQT